MLPPTIRVVYADDYPIIRDGMERVLDAAPRIRIVGIATDFGDVFRLLPTVHPDVVILDIIGMCGSPLATVKRINQDYPGIRIIMFSSSISMAPEMLAAGRRALPKLRPQSLSGDRPCPQQTQRWPGRRAECPGAVCALQHL